MEAGRWLAAEPRGSHPVDPEGRGGTSPQGPSAGGAGAARCWEQKEDPGILGVEFSGGGEEEDILLWDLSHVLPDPRGAVP